MTWFPLLMTTLVLGAMPQAGLEAEIRAASVPEGGTVLCVSPEAASPSQGASAQDLAGIARRCGRITMRMGDALTVAPATMKLLLNAPKEPNPFLDLQPREAFRLLAARLEGKEWAMLTGEEGLGYDDLKDADARFLFVAVVRPGGRLLVSATTATAGKPYEGPVDLTAKASQARLRLSSEVRAMLVYGQNQFMSVTPQGRYLVHQQKAPSDGRIMGAEAFRIQPNGRKPSQLDDTGPRFTREVDLSGVVSVGDLIGRIAKICEIELFADPRLAGQRLVVHGREKAKAADLLRGIALGVTGTYRRVGPAYVLTDSLVGVGASRESWSRFVAKGLTRLWQEQALAESWLAEGFDPRVVKAMPGSLGYTPEQKVGADRETSGQISGLETVYSRLTHAQKQAALTEKRRASLDGQAAAVAADERVKLSEVYRLDILHPDLDAPATLDGASDFLARKPSPPSSSAESPTVEWGSFRPKTAILPPDLVKEDVFIRTLLRAGVKRIWLDVKSAFIPGLGPTLDALRTKGFAVGLRIDLFPPAPAGLDADRSISGEASPYPRPDSSTAAAQRKEIAEELLKLGVDSVMVKRPFPPGYSQFETQISEDMRSPLGYTEAARLAFLRQHGADPIDVFRYGTLPMIGFGSDALARIQQIQSGIGAMMWALELENFDRQGAAEALANAWNDARYARLEAGLADFCARISPKMPCFVTSTRSPASFASVGYSSWIGEWNGTGAAPGRDPGGWPEKFYPQKAVQGWQKASGRPVLVPIKIETATTPAGLAEFLTRTVELGAEGVVLDLHDVKAGDAKVLKLLEALRNRPAGS